MSAHFLTVAPGVKLKYVVDDYTDPWATPETVLMVHGFGEAGAVWFGWVPHLARHFRVVRVDQRGFGDSTAMPEDFPWSLDVFGNDLADVIRALGRGPVHLVAAKISGPIVMHFAATHPELVKSLTVVGSMSKGPDGVDEWVDHIRAHGMESWARKTMPPRLGTDMPPAAVEWWIRLTARTPVATALGLLPRVTGVDVTPALPLIRCPVLVITTDSQRRPLAKTKEWQRLIPNSTLVALPGDAYHAAASAADACATTTRDFLLHLKEGAAS